MFNKPLTALPFQVIDFEGGVVLKRGNKQLVLSGEKVLEIVLFILTVTSGRTATISEISDKFPKSLQNEVQELIKHLVEKKFLVPKTKNSSSQTEETNFDVFQWNAGEENEKTNPKLVDRNICMVGVSSLSSKILKGLSDIGVKNVTIVDDPLLRESTHRKEPRTISLERFEQLDIEEFKTLIGVAQFGGQEFLLPWNQLCVENNIHFFPIVLQDMIGYMGPLVVPGETACLQCLRTRQNSHLTSVELTRVIEKHAFQGQQIASIHPSMLDILSGMSVLEIYQAYSKLYDGKSGTLIKMDLVQGLSERKFVLKIPRCSVCSSLLTKTSIKKFKMSPMQT